DWQRSSKLVLLARKTQESDHRLCLASGIKKAGGNASGAEGPGSKESAQDAIVWRVFRNSACERLKVVTVHEGQKFQWVIAAEPHIFVPEHATGLHLSLCYVPAASSSPSEQQGKKKKKKQKAAGPYFTFVEGHCPAGSKRELSFNSLSAADVLNYVQLMDEIV
ncbi:unnamed protein product, partial [Polarella glacialis]